MLQRPRRNRKTEAIRSLHQETLLSSKDLIMPFFVLKGECRKEENKDLPGLSKLSKDEIVKEAKKLHALGLQAILLFPAETIKDEMGTEALCLDGAVPGAISLLKKEIPSLCVLCDIALDPYTTHGQDGVLDKNGYVANDATVEILSKMSTFLAECGADGVAPSDMMDGRVEAIRRALDAKGFTETAIISYTAKYASSLYGPFRDTLGSQLQKGDKKTYQMDPCNAKEAVREALLDEQEGADALIVKPATFYLDIIHKVKQATHLPIYAYHVSGEYAMIMAAHKKGYLDAEKAFLEALTSIKRAGADCIISYAAPLILEKILPS
jgi:porphobilinogen synthase